MKITFLVGNGFDIGAGINTSYSDFYKWYCDQPSARSCIHTFKQDIKNDVANGGENWSDFEIGLGRYTANFTIETAEQFIDCYEDAHEKIIEYLEIERKKYSDSLSDAESKRLREGVANFYQELPPVERNKFESIFKEDEANNTIIQLVSFNYTSILDKCAEILAKEPLKQWTYTTTKQMKVNKPVIHIHGTSDLFPILGVNDSSQIKNQELLSVPQFTETIVKSQSVEVIGQLWHSQVIATIKESQIICIMGMSIGDSDAIWWERIMSWLKSSENRHLLIFWHTDTPMSSRSIYKYRKEITKVKSKIIDYSDFTKDDIKSVDNRIHVVLNSTQFLKISLTEKPEVVTVNL